MAKEPTGFEPAGGREFESLRARHKINGLYRLDLLMPALGTLWGTGSAGIDELQLIRVRAQNQATPITPAQGPNVRFFLQSGHSKAAM